MEPDSLNWLQKFYVEKLIGYSYDSNYNLWCGYNKSNIYDCMFLNEINTGLIFFIVLMLLMFIVLFFIIKFFIKHKKNWWKELNREEENNDE